MRTRGDCQQRVVFAVAGLALQLVRAACAGAAASQPPARLVIAALPFTHAAADARYAPLAEAVGDLLMAHLSSAKSIAFVERQAIDKVLAEHELAALLRPAGQARIGQLMGAQYVLTGSVTAIGDKLQINAHLLEVATTRVARSVKVAATGDQLVEPIGALARDLTRDLDLQLPKLTDAQIDREPRANLHFMRGLGYHFAKMPDHAIAQFMKALAVKPDHARARYWNARTYFEEGEYAHAHIELDRFLKEFPGHELAPEVKKMAATCAAELKKVQASQGE